MGKVSLFIIAAIVSYLVSGLNPAIIMSNAIYHQDIRKLGSKNPGFTNFKRVFGNRYAWFVFALDILKSLLPCLVFGLLFRRFFDMYQIGAAFTGFFGMIGHIFPVWYGFKGGKGFLVAAAAIWIMDWRVGAITTVIFMIVLFTTHYMSLASISAAVVSPILLAVFGFADAWVMVFCIICAALLIARHAENIGRLFKGNESKFYLKK